MTEKGANYAVDWLVCGAAKVLRVALLSVSFARLDSGKLPRNDIAVTTWLRVSSRAFN